MDGMGLFLKMSFIIITINAFMFFVLAGTNPSTMNGDWTWLPSYMTSEGADYNHITSSNIAPVGISDTNATGSIESTSGNSGGIPQLTNLLDIFGVVYKLFFLILFGYFAWLQALGLPFAFAAAVSAPLFMIQLFGLFEFFRIFVGSLGTALGWLH